MLYLSIRLSFIKKEETEILIENTNKISRMLRGLLKSIKN
ncbi:MAG: hypothetical protein HKP48_11175 [Winogradskyella sp.]|nr:hypothetical protein [Winogradskyella sp.]NNK23822.1 hypothetical protein [Winogradskyella sp.]